MFPYSNTTSAFGDAEMPPLKYLCIYCYKTDSKHSDIQSGTGLETCRKFINLLGRFLGESSWKPVDHEELLSKNSKRFLGCCGNCIDTITAFCVEFHQLKCVELKLQWRVERLIKIMKLANRVPSRVQQLRRYFEDHLERPADAVTSDGKAEFDNFARFRQNIIRKCKRKLSKCQPRVVLKRLEDDNVSAIRPPLSPTTIHDSNNPNRSQPGLEVFFGWVFSFAAVVSLTATSGTRSASRCSMGDTMASTISLVTCDVDNGNVFGGNEDELAAETLTSEVGEDFLGDDLYEPAPSPHRPEEGNDVDINNIENHRVVDANSSQTTWLKLEPEDRDKVPNVMLHHVNTDTHEPLAEYTNVNQTCEMDTEATVVEELTTNPEPGTAKLTTTIPARSAKRGRKVWSDKTLQEQAPFSCTMCEMRFKHKRSLQQHLHKIHSQSPEVIKSITKSDKIPRKGKCHPCPFCDKTFTTYGYMRIHKMRCQSNPVLRNHQQLESKITEDDTQDVGTTCEEIEMNTPTAVIDNVPGVVAELEQKHNPEGTEIKPQETGKAEVTETAAPSTRYQLRKKKNISYVKMEQDDDGHDSHHEDNLDNLDSESENESISSSSGCESENDYRIQVKRPRLPRKNKIRKSLLCYLDGCSRRFNTEEYYDQHQKWHAPGNYKCKFCHETQGNLIQLSTHEIKMHSTRKSTKAAKISYCPRHTPPSTLWQKSVLGPILQKASEARSRSFASRAIRFSRIR